MRFTGFVRASTTKVARLQTHDHTLKTRQHHIMDAQEFLDRLAGLWEDERQAELDRQREQRANSTIDVRETRGIALQALTMRDMGLAPGGRSRVYFDVESDYFDMFRGRTGSPATLWWVAGEERHNVDAVIERKLKDGLKVVLPGTVPDHIMTGGTVRLELDAPQTTFERGARAIQSCKEAKKSMRLGELRDVLIANRMREQERVSDISFFDENLNDSQKAAVEDCLAQRDLALIHGPPGTGKTRTLVEVVRQEVARGKRVLVTAASNAAVDNIAERLVETGIDLVRLGHPARVSDNIEPHTLDALLEARPDFKHANKWMEEARRIFNRVDVRSDRGSMGRRERREMLQEARYLMRDARNHLRGVQRAILAGNSVICSTASGADSQLLEDDDQFDVVVLDEATQCPDPIALVPLLRAQKLIMAGDPKQLPPTVLNNANIQHGLDETFFERLTTSASLLDVQYRMHEDIMRFSNNAMYDGMLRAHDSVAHHSLDDLGVEVDYMMPTPLVFLDTAGKGWDDERSDDDPSTHNPQQATRTVEEVVKLLDRGLDATQISVITPYDAQRREIQKLLGEVDVHVGTIDAFQGQENEAVVVDLVRSNPNGELGFLKDYRRMNVALTRAKRFLLVIGDSATIGSDSFFSEFLETVEAHGTWASAWS